MTLVNSDILLFFFLQVFSRLLFPIVRGSTMVVLSHMLLSFQHSPQAFHEVKISVSGLV